MVAELGKNGEKFWNKMKQLEVEFYRMKMALADGSGELKKEVSALFNTLRMVTLQNCIILPLISYTQGGPEYDRGNGWGQSR